MPGTEPTEVSEDVATIAVAVVVVSAEAETAGEVAMGTAEEVPPLLRALEVVQ